MYKVCNLIWILPEISDILGIDNLQQSSHRLFCLCVLLFYVEVAAYFVHLLGVLKVLEQESLGWLAHMVGLKLLRSLVKVFKKQNNFTWVNVGLLEPVYDLGVVNGIHQHDPASVQVEHLKSLHIVVRPFISPSDEHLSGLCDAVRIKQLVNLLLPTDLLHHKYLRL